MEAEKNSGFYSFLLGLYIFICLLFPAIDILSLKKIVFVLIVCTFVLEMFLVGGWRFSSAVAWRFFIILFLGVFSLIGVTPDNRDLTHGMFLLTALLGLLIGVVYSQKNVNALKIFINV